MRTCIHPLNFARHYLAVEPKWRTVTHIQNPDTYELAAEHSSQLPNRAGTLISS